MPEIYKALDSDRWTGAVADAIALATRRHYLDEKAAGTARPQAAVAAVRGVNQQNVSRAVARGDEVVGDPDRLGYALTLARAAGVEVDLVGDPRVGDAGKP